MNVCVFSHRNLVHGLIPTKHSKIFIKRKEEGEKDMIEEAKGREERRGKRKI